MHTEARFGIGELSNRQVSLLLELQGSTPGLHALFTGEDDTWEAWLSVDSSGLASIVNLQYNGIKLRRGYVPSESKKPTQDELRQQKEEEMDGYCSQVPVFSRFIVLAKGWRNQIWWMMLHSLHSMSVEKGLDSQLQLRKSRLSIAKPLLTWYPHHTCCFLSSVFRMYSPQIVG